jgi:hypothetical protein
MGACPGTSGPLSLQHGVGHNASIVSGRSSVQVDGDLKSASEMKREIVALIAVTRQRQLAERLHDERHLLVSSMRFERLPKHMPPSSQNTCYGQKLSWSIPSDHMSGAGLGGRHGSGPR